MSSDESGYCGVAVQEGGAGCLCAFNVICIAGLSAPIEMLTMLGTG